MIPAQKNHIFLFWLVCFLIRFYRNRLNSMWNCWGVVVVARLCQYLAPRRHLWPRYLACCIGHPSLWFDVRFLNFDFIILTSNYYICLFWIMFCNFQRGRTIWGVGRFASSNARSIDFGARLISRSSWNHFPYRYPCCHRWVASFNCIRSNDAIRRRRTGRTCERFGREQTMLHFITGNITNLYQRYLFPLFSSSFFFF